MRNSSHNEIDANVIRDNGDGLVDEIFCKSGSGHNVGSNVPADSPCAGSATYNAATPGAPEDDLSD